MRESESHCWQLCQITINVSASHPDRVWRGEGGGGREGGRGRGGERGEGIYMALAPPWNIFRPSHGTAEVIQHRALREGGDSGQSPMAKSC